MQLHACFLGHLGAGGRLLSGSPQPRRTSAFCWCTLQAHARPDLRRCVLWTAPMFNVWFDDVWCVYVCQVCGRTAVASLLMMVQVDVLRLPDAGCASDTGSAAQ